LQKQNKKYVVLAAKIIMLMLLFVAIYVQLFSNTKANTISNAFNHKFELHQLAYFFVSFILIAFNFFCETKKWLSLTNVFYKLSFTKAYKAVLAGTTMAFFTPNRIGEYGGRVLFVPQKYLVETVAVTMVGGLAQQIITLLFGLVSLFFLKDALLTKMIFTETQMHLITFTSLILFVVLLLLFFYIKYAIKVIPQVKWLKKHFDKLKLLQQYSKVALLKVMLWAALKYLIFSMQFYFLILAFDIPFQINFVWLSMLSFLLQTLIPSVSLFELGIRGNVVLFTFGAFTHLKIEILAASVTLWIFNLLIPAIIGAFYILKINFLNE